MWNNNHPFKNFERFFVGFDKVVDRLSAEQYSTSLASKYPPYNIKKIDENLYTIEMAVAGFSKQDIDIELLDSKLRIKGNIQTGESAKPIPDEECLQPRRSSTSRKDSTSDRSFPTILYQGLAMRPFTHLFTLADNIEVKNAELVNGILKIVLEAIIPGHTIPRKISITSEGDEEESTAEFLSEHKYTFSRRSQRPPGYLDAGLFYCPYVPPSMTLMTPPEVESEQSQSLSPPPK